MHLNLTTSKRISLVFTLYSIGIVLFFGIAINVIFFRQWYLVEDTNLLLSRNMPTPMVGFGRGRFAQPLVDSLPYNQDTVDLLQEHTIFLNIAHIDGQYLMYRTSWQTIKISLVTRLVDAQRRLINVFLWLVIVFSFLTFWLSRLIVRKNLRNINTLVSYVQHLDLDSIEKPVPVSGPADDEIRMIGEALQRSLTTIKQQTDSLRDFITYTSHELKTPLMSLNSTIDLWLKTWTHAQTLEEAKRTIYHINSLFDTLLSITKREHEKLHKEPVDVVPIITDVIAMVKHVYADKWHTITTHLPKTYTLTCHADGFRTIVYNLLQNACKYTPARGKIVVTLAADEHSLSVADTWPWIRDADKPNIRKKFRKNHTRGIIWATWATGSDDKWFGLWLYLVSLLVQKQWWHIEVMDVIDGIKSRTKKWALFTVTF